MKMIVTMLRYLTKMAGNTHTPKNNITPSPVSSCFQDKEMILIACANSFGEALKFVDESFYKEKDFMIQVVFSAS